MGFNLCAMEKCLDQYYKPIIWGHIVIVVVLKVKWSLLLLLLINLTYQEKDHAFSQIYHKAKSFSRYNAIFIIGDSSTKLSRWMGEAATGAG